MRRWEKERCESCFPGLGCRQLERWTFSAVHLGKAIGMKQVWLVSEGRRQVQFWICWVQCAYSVSKWKYWVNFGREICSRDRNLRLQMLFKAIELDKIAQKQVMTKKRREPSNKAWNTGSQSRGGTSEELWETVSNVEAKLGEWVFLEVKEETVSRTCDRAIISYDAKRLNKMRTEHCFLAKKKSSTGQ